MSDRIIHELELLQKRYSGVDYREEGRWVRVPAYPLPTGWDRSQTDVAFQINVDYPGTRPYGFYVPSGLRYRNTSPSSYTESPSPLPPFGGNWGVFSWYAEDGQWQPTADLVTGSNLLKWVRSFATRFGEGA